MHTRFYICIIEQFTLYIKTKIVCVGPYENTFFTLLATEDTYAVGVADIATFVESFYGKCVGRIRKGRMKIL